MIFISHSIPEMSFLGGPGVSIFIILSGFLMQYNYGDAEIRSGNCTKRIQFAYKRIRKLYPLHLFMITFLGIVFFRSYLINEQWYEIKKLFISYLCDYILVQSWIPDSSFYWSLNAVSWYLSTCVFLYFCYPSLKKIIKIINDKWLLGSAVVLFSLLFFLTYIVPENMKGWFSYIFPLYRLGEFYFGCIVAVYVEKQKKYIKQGYLEWCIVLCLLYDVLLKLMVPDIWYNKSLSYTLSSIVLIMAYYLLEHKTLLNNRGLTKIGDLSGYAFLVHQVIIGYTSLFFDRILHVTINAYCNALISFLLSFLIAYMYNNFLMKSWSQYY